MPALQSEFPPNRDFSRTRSLNVLQTAVVSAVDLVAASYKLLGGATVGDIEDIRDHLERRTFVQPELTSYPGIPGDQPRRPQMALAACSIVEARRRRQQV